MSLRDWLKTSFVPPTAAERTAFATRAAPVMPPGLPLPTIALTRYATPTWLPTNVNTFVSTYQNVVVVFACVNIIADAAATAPLRIYDEAANNAEIETHALRELLRRPNVRMSESEFWNCMVKVAAVCGFAVAEKQRSAAGRVVALNPLRSDWLSPVPRSDGQVDWLYQVPGSGPGSGKYELIAEDVFAWTYQGGPLIPAAGVPVLAAANREIGIETACTDFIKAFFDSGALPQIGLVPADNAVFTQAQADEVREKFLQSGAGNPWAPLVMQAIKEVVRLGFDLNEMAYKDLRALTSTQIATAYRVPDVMLGTLVGLENSPWSKYEEARKSFYEDTITPLWSRLDGAVERQLLPEFETKPSVVVAFDTSDVPALREDNSQTWLNAASPGIQKLLTVNELRGELGYAPIVGGDVRLLTVADLEIPAIDQTTRRSTWQTGSLVESRFIVADDGLLLRPDVETRTKIGRQSQATIIKLGKRTAPIMRRFWREQGERVQHSIFGTARANGHALDLREDEVIDLNDENRHLAIQLERIYHLGGKEAFDAASDLLGVDLNWSGANPNIHRVLGKLLQRANSINETTKEQLRQLIDASLAEGVSMPDLANRIQDQFDGYSGARAETTARTESQIAYNSATTLAYRESGLVEQAELLDNPDHGNYDGDDDGLTCAERNGLVVALEQVSRHVEGTHPNCILAVSPILTTALGELDEE